MRISIGQTLWIALLLYHVYDAVVKKQSPMLIQAMSRQSSDWMDTKIPVVLPGDQPSWNDSSRPQQPVSTTTPKRMQIPLSVLTRLDSQASDSCPANTTKALSNPIASFNRSNYKIPMIVHQTFKDRCLNADWYNIHQVWKNLGFPYYFHTDESIDDLVLSGLFPEFPHLPLVWKHCIIKPVVKTDFWRLLLLWEYGGIYADLDTKPLKALEHEILPEDDMYTLNDGEGTPSFHFMASVPRHPLLFLTLQESIKELLFKGDIGIYNPAKISGPGAIKRAMPAYLAKEDKRQQDAMSGDDFNFTGLLGYKMRRVGTGRSGNKIVAPNALQNKAETYRKSNATHYSHQRKAVGVSCFEAILEHYGVSRLEDIPC